MPRSPPADQSGPCAATYTVLLLRGSIMILARCSDLASIGALHVLPPSVLL
jgi:hypothetical protein